METNTERKPYEIARDERNVLIEAAISDFSMIATHVPNNAENPRELRLDYQVETFYKGRSLLKTPYSMGIAHIPDYEKKRKELNGYNWSLDFDCWVRDVCMTGKVRKSKFSQAGSGTPILPELRDIVYCLLSDGDAINHRDFEDWASEFGYDTDSRKAEALYRVCLDIGLKMRNTLGEAKLEQLREVYQDY